MLRRSALPLLGLIAISASLALPASAGVGGRLFFYNDAKRAIPDSPGGGGVLSKIKLSTGARIADLEVGVRINHRSVDDLNLYLISPQGKFVELSTDNGGSGDNYGTGPNRCGGGGSFTVFNDEAARSIRNGAAPFAGGFRPQTRLAPVEGRARGTWRLMVFDDEPGIAGTIGCFALGIRFR